MISKDFFLVLASGSRYRQELLSRFGLPFESWVPAVDESALAGEVPRDTAARLALAKARAGSAEFPNAWVVGSDQVAELDGRALGKPGNRENARKQLAAMRGRTVAFHTAVCLRHGARDRLARHLVTTLASFRAYTDDEIDRYIEREPSFDCAGSAKCEGLGVSLLERLSGDDPTALVGLPLIALGEMLRAEGFRIP